MSVRITPNKERTCACCQNRIRGNNFNYFDYTYPFSIFVPKTKREFVSVEIVPICKICSSPIRTLIKLGIAPMRLLKRQKKKRFNVRK